MNNAFPIHVRGQKVLVDYANKVVSFTIKKPLNGRFSLSDSLCHFLNEGYKIRVTLPKGEKVIESMEEIVETENVHSKFKNSPDWKRYWFEINKPKITEQQLELSFN